MAEGGAYNTGKKTVVTKNARRAFAQFRRSHVVEVRHESVKALNASENCNLASSERHLCEIAPPAGMNLAENASCVDVWPMFRMKCALKPTWQRGKKWDAWLAKCVRLLEHLTHELFANRSRRQ